MANAKYPGEDCEIKSIEGHVLNPSCVMIFITACAPVSSEVETQSQCWWGNNIAGRTHPLMFPLFFQREGDSVLVSKKAQCTIAEL